MTEYRATPDGQPWPTQRTVVRGKRQPYNPNQHLARACDAAEWQAMIHWVGTDRPVWHPAADGAY